MRITKTIKITLLLLYINIAAIAQNAVHYQYDISGNRVNRRIEAVQPIAPPQSSNNIIVADTSASLSNITSASLINLTLATLNSQSNAINLSEGDIKVFPNPVESKLNIAFTGTASAEACSMQMFDSKASLYYSQSTMQKLTEIDMQDTKAGNYFLVISTKEGKRLYWKLVKK